VSAGKQLLSFLLSLLLWLFIYKLLPTPTCLWRPSGWARCYRVSFTSESIRSGLSRPKEV